MNDFHVFGEIEGILKGRKTIKLLEFEQSIYHCKARHLEILNI